jgi:hydrogenase maturation protein HypF
MRSLCHHMDSAQIQHLQIRVSGTVQGVGFRPFVFALARRFSLAGSVHNNSRGVIIHVQGPKDRVDGFLHDLRHAAPPAARVENLFAEALAPDDYTEFRILPSEALGDAFTQISPDLALCTDCQRELLDPRDRRHDYPFINCTNCGPRFTIIRAVPYDRPQTTMSEFVLCDSCRAEYENPSDRRFHAQPVACPECGPQLAYLERRHDDWHNVTGGNNSLAFAVQALQNGKILLLQGIGGFHLACDARNDDCVRELRRRKHRDEKPLAMMLPDLESARQCCELSDVEERFLASWRAPIVLLKTKNVALVAESVAPQNPCWGVMLPYSPLHALLLKQFAGPLVMTSANLSDEPIAFRVEDALARMADIADSALIHDRPIHMFADDSVAKVIHGRPRVWRRTRGYVPQSVHVPIPFHVPTLAFGPELKCTFCLGKQDAAILSQHLGDMESVAAHEEYGRVLEHFLKLYDADIALGACDLHPDYATTRLAESWCGEHRVPLVRVQHHHAHMAACLAENEHVGPAIGLCLDGTGYGMDGSIWGGEVLVGNLREFRRAGHLQNVPLLGGALAAQQPWRMALAWLSALDRMRAPQLFAKRFENFGNEIEMESLEILLNSQHLFPRTSSLGRLFDAVAALLFFETRKQFEGQAAMMLEGLISGNGSEAYVMDVVHEKDAFILSPLPMFTELLRDLQNAVDRGIIARRFHQSVVNGFCELCRRVRDECHLSVVALSGGCFQNAYLLSEMEMQLTMDGFTVLSHEHIPPGDGGIALGQAVIADAQGA